MSKRLKNWGLVLSTATAVCLVPSVASAEPVSLFIASLAASAATAIGATAAVSAVVGTVVKVLATVAVTTAVQFAATALLAPKESAALNNASTGNAASGGRALQATVATPSAVRGTTKGTEPPRRWIAGAQAVGGSVVVAFVKDGRLFKLVAHGDSEATIILDYYFGAVKLDFNSANTVTNESFVSGDRTYYVLTTRTGTKDQLAMPKLVAALPEWTEDHIGAGVCDTLLELAPVKIEDRAKILRNPGALGVGEADVTLAAYFGRYYDPRDSNQVLNDPDTWGPNIGNAALTWAAHRLDVERFAMNVDDINWEHMKAQADICDEAVSDRYGKSIKRYEIGLTVNKPAETNISAENRILAACDGIVVEFENGTIGIRVGKYYEPTLTLTEDDVFDLESTEVENGTEGVTHYFPSYTEPEFGYTEQTAAPYVMPGYVDGENLKSQSFPVYACLEHNQAVRVCKAASLRLAEKKRCAFTVNMRGMRAKSERFLRLDFGDDPLSGVYEIAPVVDLYTGAGGILSVIATDPNRWDLEIGEEGERPNFNTEITLDASIPNVDAADMNIQAASEQASNGTSLVRFTATFIALDRQDVVVQIQYREVGNTFWRNFSVDSEEGIGISDFVSDGETYEFQWRGVTLAGGGSDFSDIITVDAVADTAPTEDLSNISVTSANPGEIDTSYKAPNSTNYLETRIYRSSDSPPNFGDVNNVHDEAGAPNSNDSYLVTGLTAGDYHIWLEPLNGSGIAGTRAGPFSVTVT